jgi:hypothetical protein
VLDVKAQVEMCLEDLELRLDDEVESGLRERWLSFINNDFRGEVFLPERKKASPARIKWPQVTVNEALFSFEKMALQQLGSCSDILEKGYGSLLDIRCNYGTGIMTSLFGAEIYYMEEHFNTLPMSLPLEGGINRIRDLIDQGVPDITGGLGEKVFETARYFIEITEPYPKISKYVKIFHPDLQGPMDICEMLWGSRLFLDIYDNPSLVHQLLDLITQTYIRFVEEWVKIVPFGREYNTHWGMMHKGNIMLRDDSAMNLSPAMFDEFVRPYDQILLNRLGGGAIHFCGRGDHYITSMSQMKGVFAINLSQPQCNDMEKIYQNTVDKGIKIIGFDRQHAEKALRNGRRFGGNLNVY